VGVISGNHCENHVELCHIFPKKYLCVRFGGIFYEISHFELS
jgi:hypothetical protein